uniref:DNA polymerase alpha subunit B n=1 Tax=Chrysolophus pictus TaxID=9089 RepID=A0A8C3LMV6_CHRPC
PKIAPFHPKRSSRVGAVRGAAGLWPLHPVRQRRLRAPAGPDCCHRPAAPRRLRDELPAAAALCGGVQAVRADGAGGDAECWHPAGLCPLAAGRSPRLRVPAAPLRLPRSAQRGQGGTSFPQKTFFSPVQPFLTQGLLWQIWGHFGWVRSHLGPLGATLRSLGVDFGVILCEFGVTLSGFGVIWGHFVWIWGDWVNLGPLWVDLGSFGATLGGFWVDLGPFWVDLGSRWSRFGAVWGQLSPHKPISPTEGALHAGSLHPGHQRGGAGPHLHRPPLPYGHRGDQQVPLGGGKKKQIWDFVRFYPFFPRFPLFFALFPDLSPHFSPCSSSGTSDRFTRILQHILTQRSYYPLYPPAEEMNVDYESFSSFASLPVTPHVLVTPSELRYFVKEVLGCVCINPGRLTKGRAAGTYGQLCLQQQRGGEQKNPCVAAQVVRI